ncbi:LAQU0S01e11430g1_1 [Lachancea quebecensis]|uniref:DNA replication regulator SLD2 n=1 Tax=Lachancea quebecensis TaxID=1654605 RepID=A0A0P1KLJ7_9SACH|nr:LAQU0S01e11430g1_1 [Lachancea quebecensis]
MSSPKPLSTELSMDMDQLKLELKRFEKQFQRKHKRPPARDDVRALPDIKEKYKQYSAFQLAKQKKDPAPNLRATPRRYEEVELGPTPQIYGKAISLFEMKLSPLKPVTVVSPQTSSHSPQAMTTEVSHITAEEIHQFKSQPDLSLTPKRSPKKATYGPNSPMKFDNVQLSVHTPRRNLRALLNDNVNNTPGSPSPIIKRPSGKPLRQILEEHEKLMEDLEEMSDEEVVRANVKDVFQDDSDATEDEEIDEAMLIKKPKRKHILRPAKDALAAQQPFQVNVHEEMERLKQQAASGIDGTIPVKKPVLDPKGKGTKTRRGNRKYNLVSNNFRRLKLPKAKGRGGKRWGRR